MNLPLRVRSTLRTVGAVTFVSVSAYSLSRQNFHPQFPPSLRLSRRSACVQCESAPASSLTTRLREAAAALISPRSRDSPEPEPATIEPTVAATSFQGATSLKEQLQGAAGWSVFAAAWALTVLTPVLVSFLVISGHWLSLSLYSIFWYLVNSERLKLTKSDSLVHWLQTSLALWLRQGVVINAPPHSADARAPTLYCVHPHGVLSAGFFLCALELAKREPDLAVVGNPYVFSFCPLVRVLFGLLGLELCSSAKEDFQRVMAQRRPMIFMPGGFQEASLARNSQPEAVYLQKRHGFVKYALAFGYDIQPVFVFGENKLYRTASALESTRLAVSGWNFPSVLFWGLSFAPWLPLRDGSLRVVFGTKTGAAVGATAEEVKKQYVQSLSSLYSEYEGAALRIV